MSDPISCPKCDCTGTASIIIDHFYIDHSEYILNYESTIAMDLNKSSYEHYLYIDESRDVVSLALATYDIIDDDFKVFTFDGQILSKKTNAVTQKVELYTVSNKLQWSSDDITCAKWPTDENKQIIEVNIKDHDYSHNLMLCKVFLTHLREENLQPAEVPFLSETKNEPSLLKSNIPYCSKNNLELFDNSGNISEGPLSSFDLSPDYPRYSILTCSKCGCECTSVEELADHLLSNSCTKNVAPAKETTTDLKCKKCALICKSLAGLASHSRSHNKVASVKEPIKTAVSARNEPSSDIHKCGTLCKSGAGLASHLRAHDRAKNTAKQAPAKESNTSVKGDRKCTKCGLVCKSLAGLASHNREHDKKESTKAPAPVINEPSDNMLKCSQCGTLCKSGAGLSSHLRAHDRANNAPKQTPAKESYTKEQAKSTPPATNEPRGDIHKCGQCEMLCKSVAGLASHMRAHERAAQNGPSVKDSLLSQMKAPVTNNVFGISSSKSCSICGIVCQSGAGLASHMRAHERRTTSSNFDGFTPDYGSSVDRMLSLISMSGSGGGGYSSGGGGYSSGGGGGGYSCGECGRVCASGAGLASHMRAHARR